MDAIEAILTRRVVRTLSKTSVPLEQLQLIADAGRHAMSARNLQPWRFVIIRDPATLKQLGALCSTGRFLADSPSAIAVFKNLDNKRWAEIDCAQAVQNMADAAWALGLGTCWVGNFDAEAIGKLLAAPEGWAAFTVLPFGQPDPASPPQAKPLKTKSEVVFLERFDGRKSP